MCRAIGKGILAGVLIISTPATLLAQGEHGRRAGSELLVLLGDVNKLVQEDLEEQHRAGLVARIAGGLSGLPILLRLAAEEQQNPQAIIDAQELRTLLKRGAYGVMRDRLSQLSARYPLSISGFYPAGGTPDGMRRASEIHRTLCAACHDQPYLNTQRPAFNLFSQAQETLLPEFVARMLVGIRGDRVTGIENPFSDQELSDLVAYYRSVAGPSPEARRSGDH